MKSLIKYQDVITLKRINCYTKNIIKCGCFQTFVRDIPSHILTKKMKDLNWKPPDFSRYKGYTFQISDFPDNGNEIYEEILSELKSFGYEVEINATSPEVKVKKRTKVEFVEEDNRLEKEYENKVQQLREYFDKFQRKLNKINIEIPYELGDNFLREISPYVYETPEEWIEIFDKKYNCKSCNIYFHFHEDSRLYDVMKHIGILSA